MPKTRIHNLIILDESGSMMSIKTSIISAFNEVLGGIAKSQKNDAELEHAVTFLTFEQDRFTFHSKNAPVDKLVMLTDATYQPGGSTPLYDAIALGIKEVQKAIAKEKKAAIASLDTQVLVSILTDGEENASHKYTGPQIKAMIETLELAGWTFTYMGTDHDVTAAAGRMGITQSRSFDKSAAGVLHMVMEDTNSRLQAYEQMKRREKPTDFFMPKVEKSTPTT